MWDGFTKLYGIIYFNDALESHSLFNYPKLMHFLKSWDSYRMLNFIHFVGHNQTPPSCWKLGLGSKWLPQCLIYLIKDNLDCKN
jgi:hypothetical protein